MNSPSACCRQPSNEPSSPVSGVSKRKAMTSSVANRDAAARFPAEYAAHSPFAAASGDGMAGRAAGEVAGSDVAGKVVVVVVVVVDDDGGTVDDVSDGPDRATLESSRDSAAAT